MKEQPWTPKQAALMEAMMRVTARTKGIPTKCWRLINKGKFDKIKVTDTALVIGKEQFPFNDPAAMRGIVEGLMANIEWLQFCNRELGDVRSKLKKAEAFLESNPTPSDDELRKLWGDAD